MTINYFLSIFIYFIFIKILIESQGWEGNEGSIYSSGLIAIF
jgi:hypothetical protein